MLKVTCCHTSQYVMRPATRLTVGIVFENTCTYIVWMSRVWARGQRYCLLLSLLPLFSPIWACKASKADKGIFLRRVIARWDLYTCTHTLSVGTHYSVLGDICSSETLKSRSNQRTCSRPVRSGAGRCQSTYGLWVPGPPGHMPDC